MFEELSKEDLINLQKALDNAKKNQGISGTFENVKLTQLNEYNDKYCSEEVKYSFTQDCPLPTTPVFDGIYALCLGIFNEDVSLSDELRFKYVADRLNFLEESGYTHTANLTNGVNKLVMDSKNVVASFPSLNSKFFKAIHSKNIKTEFGIETLYQEWLKNEKI